MKKKRKFLQVNREAAAIIAERAEEWLERMKHSRDPNDRVEFLAWLKESPLHVREILSATTWDKVLDHMLDPDHKVNIDDLQVQAATNVVPLSAGISRDAAAAAEALVKPRSMRDRRIGWPWLAGLGAAACVSIAVTLGWLHLTKPSEPQQQFVTAIGEQRSIGLTDGSIIHLNTRSDVHTAYSATARDVYLNEGQATFKVSHDPTRPFRVHVDSTVVQAIGTQFDVHRLKDRTSVAVIDGVVQIISGGAAGSLDPEALSKLPESTKIPAGESVVIVADGKLTPHQAINPQEATAWQQRRLVFRNQTLAEIAAEFNRYNRTPQIRIEGEGLRARRLAFIVFNATDPQSLIDYLALDDRIAFVRTGDEYVIRMRSTFAQTTPGN